MRTKYLSAIVVAVSLYLSACTPAPTIDNFNNSITSGDLKNLQAIHNQNFLDQAKNKEAVDNAILVAAKSATPEVLRFLLDAGYPLESKDTEGNTALLLSAQNNDINTTKLLLDAGADVNARDKSQLTPLMAAVKTAKSSAIVSALLAAGADINATDEDGWTALHFTVNNQDEPAHDLADIAKLLLEAGANKEAKTKSGGTPLALAAYHNKPQTLNVLLDAGADVNARGKSQWTPLMAAVNYAKSPAIVSALLAAGADVNATYEDGWTALHFTVNNQDEPAHDLADIAKLLLEAGANKEAKTKSGGTPLAIAAYHNKPQTLKVLLDAGADVDVRAKSQRTPLMYAVNTAKSSAIVSALLAAGADVNATEEDGWTALHLTVNYRDEPAHDLADIAKLLLEAGANKEARIKSGDTPLALAASKNKPQTLNVLLDAGADVNARDKSQWTPLMSAVNSAKSPAIVSALLAAGADVNATNKGGWTALHLTVNNRDEPAHDLADIAKLLLEAGANKEARLESDLSALMIAGLFNKPKVARVLIDFGAYLNSTQRSSGKSALDFALQNSKNEVIEVLLSAGAISAIEDAKYPARPASRAGYLTCSTRCNNGACYRTYSDGDKVRFQAQRKFNALSGQWEFDSGSC